MLYHAGMPLRIIRQHAAVHGLRQSYLAAFHGESWPVDPGEVIVFLHAFPLHAGMWAPQLEALPEGWAAIAPDVRGFGLSEPDPAPCNPAESLDEVADDVAALLDQLGIRRAVFCGLSMGGYELLALRRRHPGRVAGMVLADTRAGADSEAGRAGRQAMLDLLAREGPPAVAAQMAPKLVGETSARERPDVRRDVARLMSGASADAIGHAVVRMMRRPDSTPGLGDIRCPALVVVGDEDGLTPVSESQALHAAIPDASLAVIPRAGHLSNLERPGAFNAALWWFLRAMGAGA